MVSYSPFLPQAKPDQARNAFSEGLVPPQECLVEMGLVSEQGLKFSVRKVEHGRNPGH